MIEHARQVVEMGIVMSWIVSTNHGRICRVTTVDRSSDDMVLRWWRGCRRQELAGGTIHENQFPLSIDEHWHSYLSIGKEYMYLPLRTCGCKIE